jgi:hypothetical protein
MKTIIEAIKYYAYFLRYGEKTIVLDGKRVPFSKIHSGIWRLGGKTVVIRGIKNYSTNEVGARRKNIKSRL